MTNSRYWRIWHAIDLVLCRGSASGRDIESLIGHITFGFLVRRPLLSSLRTLYDFSHDRSCRHRVLWPSVVRELEMIRGLLIFARWDLSLRTSPQVWAYDACPIRACELQLVC